jgi:hypothetical protein
METRFTWREWHLALEAGLVDPYFLAYEKEHSPGTPPHGMHKKTPEGQKPDEPAMMWVELGKGFGGDLLDPEKLCAAMFEGGGLASEAEWEKAGRGGCETTPGSCAANARVYPWGQQPDWCVVLGTKKQCPESPVDWDCLDSCSDYMYSAKPVGSHPLDVSVYGVRDSLAGSPEVALTDQRCIPEHHWEKPCTADNGTLIPAPDGLVGTRLPVHDEVSFAVFKGGPLGSSAFDPGECNLDESGWSCCSAGLTLSARPIHLAVYAVAAFRCVRRLSGGGGP